MTSCHCRSSASTIQSTIPSTLRSTSEGRPATASDSKSRRSRSRSKSSRKRPRRRRSSKKALPRRSNSRSAFSTSESRKRKSRVISADWSATRFSIASRAARSPPSTSSLCSTSPVPSRCARRATPTGLRSLRRKRSFSSSVAVTFASKAGRPLLPTPAASPCSRARLASRAESAKTSGGAPRVFPACSRTNPTTFATSSGVSRRSVLLRTSTTFLPHCRIASRKTRSLSA